MTLCLDHKYLELLDNLLNFGSFEPSASLGLFFFWSKSGWSSQIWLSPDSAG